MFEITGDDISLLSDADLRTLVGRLCEAELRQRNHSASSVTWGGNQTAKDGGLDVFVSLPDGAAIDSFIPKAKTGFQVKKSDMPRTAILEEMKPSGSLRPVITDLAKASGAYIIVSSSDSTSHTALQNRRKAMEEALHGAGEAGKLTLDFYDRNRVATWVREHPGLIPWIRERIGKALQGWRSFGSWSHAPSDADKIYLLDDEARIQTGHKGEEDGLTALQGVQRIRSLLSQQRQSIRLVGLSGVGKTRLCEALFDEKLGTATLDPSLAIYTDTADGPVPPPIGLASDLIASRTRAILVVDNCPADLHRRLTALVSTPESRISLITVEYDIREDQSEGTNVFSLETSSIAVIEKLVQLRYVDISQVDARTIAEFSGGNARVALALAATVGNKESISGLTDAELFKRLFEQKHPHDPDLLAIAQACSLVYSFEGVMTDGEGAELPVLAGLAGKSVHEVYTGIAEIKRRGLLQERSKWRAVLPHAVANRLATLALQNKPSSVVKAALVTLASSRLRRSFSRRLGYLDASKEALAIVNEWLSPGGLLADVTRLGDDEQAMLANVAPVNPTATLTTIENTLTGADKQTLHESLYASDLLRSLAYDARHFARAVQLLVALAEVEGEQEPKSKRVKEIITSLFQIVLSGTHAPVTIRLQVLQGLLGSEHSYQRDIGVAAMEGMLKSDHFHSSYSFDFGSRSRDYGYYPPTGKDVKDWYDAVMAFASSIALSASPMAAKILACVAGEFRGLWANGGQAETLEKLATKVGAKGFWRDGWIAARRTRIYAKRTLSADSLAQLTSVEELLRPKDLVAQVRGVVLDSSGGTMNLDDFEVIEDDDISASITRMDATVYRLGRDVAVDSESFTTLLPDLLRGGSRLARFGEGLAAGAEKPEELWQSFVKEISAKDRSDAVVMAGFLRGLHKRDETLAEEFLDEALEHSSLGSHFVQLQVYAPLNEKALQRLHRALVLGKVPIEAFYALAYGRATHGVAGPDFRALLLAISGKRGGNAVALEIVTMRLHSDTSDKREHAPAVLQVGREILGTFEFRGRDARTSREDHEMGRIARICLQGEDGIPVARHLVTEMVGAVERLEISAHDHDHLMRELMRTHPLVVLDEVFSDDRKSTEKTSRVFSDMLHYDKNPLDVVPDDVLLQWCDGNPGVRYELIAATATLFSRREEAGPHQWTSLAEQLLAKAPDRRVVFGQMVRRLHPMSWSGSLATKLEGRLRLLEQLPIGGAPDLAEEFIAAKAALEHRIEVERRREAAQERLSAGRFE